MSGPTKEPTERGARILARLEELAYSIAELERRTAKLGRPLTKNTILNAIYGPREPQRRTLKILAEALEIPPEHLTRPASAVAGKSSDPLPDAPLPDGKSSATGPSIGKSSDPISVRKSSAGKSSDPFPDPAGPAGKPPDSSFWRWLLRVENPYLWLGAGAAAAMIFVLYPELLMDRNIPVRIQLTQALVIAAFLAFWQRLRFEPGPSLQYLDPAVEAARDLLRDWRRVWLLWLFLYGALTAIAWQAIFPYPGVDPQQARWASLGLNLIQNAATVVLFWCYESVARPTIRADLSRRSAWPRGLWIAILLAVAGLEASWILAGGPWESQQLFSWVSGFSQGMALALLVGRLDSKYLEPPAAVVGLLYFYAVIQGAWPAFRDHAALVTILTFAALVLKCLLFIFLAWLFETRLILFYLTRIRQLDQDVQRDRAQFLRDSGPG